MIGKCACLVFGLVGAIVMVALSRSDLYVAGGSDSAVGILRHEAWLQIMALFGFGGALAWALFFTGRRWAVRLMALVGSLICLLMSSNMVAYSFRGGHLREFYGPWISAELSIERSHWSIAAEVAEA